MNCEAVKDCLEGDYSTWTLMWTKTGMGYYVWQSCINQASNLLFLGTQTDRYMWILDLDTGADEGSHQTLGVLNVGGTPSSSVLGKYFAFLDYSGAHAILRIYKDGVDTCDIDLTDLGYIDAEQVLISPSGQYVIIGGGSGKYMLFKGS
jgi:hypothetical protein